MGTGQVQVTGLGPMGTSMLNRSVDTGLRQGKEQRFIVSYCAGPVPRASAVPMQC